MSEAINIGQNRELFWDKTLVDPASTTQMSLHEPIRRECVAVFPAEAVIVPGQVCFPEDGKICLTYTENGVGKQMTSEDGIHFDAPSVCDRKDASVPAASSVLLCDEYAKEDDPFIPYDATASEDGKEIVWKQTAGDGSFADLSVRRVLDYFRSNTAKIVFPRRTITRSLPDGQKVTLSDTLFAVSRDGQHYLRFEKPFLAPIDDRSYGKEDRGAVLFEGFAETEALHPGCDPELSFYEAEKDPEGKTKVVRYSLRSDGFASQFAPYPEATLTLKPVIFEGNEMFINFSTSAYGHVTVTIKEAEGNAQIKSCQTFGDSIHRRVRFGKSDLSAFAGKPVVISFHMCDADLYSVIFQETSKGEN